MCLDLSSTKFCCSSQSLCLYNKNSSVIHVVKYFSCIKLIPKKKQALVEFDDVESAKNLVESSQVCDKSLIQYH